MSTPLPTAPRYDGAFIRKCFDVLGMALLKTSLPTQYPTNNGNHWRMATCEEFMFMGMANNTTASFKHSDSRNYIALDLVAGKVSYKKGHEAFHRGYFDSAE